MNKPILQHIFADNGTHSHWVLINSEGEKIWSECPEECKAMGFPVASHPAQAVGMPGELPTDEEIMQESHYRYTHNCKPLKSDRFHFEDGANWIKSRITETKNK